MKFLKKLKSRGFLASSLSTFDFSTLSSTCEKSSKKYSEDNVLTICKSSDHDQNTSEFSKESVKNL